MGLLLLASERGVKRDLYEAGSIRKYPNCLGELSFSRSYHHFIKPGIDVVQSEVLTPIGILIDPFGCIRSGGVVT